MDGLQGVARGLCGSVPLASGDHFPGLQNRGVVPYHNPPGQGYFGGVTTVATPRRGTSEVGGFAARCIARIPLTKSAASAFT